MLLCTANEDLEAETSVSFNFGVSYSPIEVPRRNSGITTTSALMT
ncbi:hypothetical protein P4S64_22930 [Vibrio sp. M60_M31a]